MGESLSIDDALYQYYSPSKRWSKHSITKSDSSGCSIWSIQDEVGPVWAEVHSTARVHYPTLGAHRCSFGLHGQLITYFLSYVDFRFGRSLCTHVSVIPILLLSVCLFLSLRHGTFLMNMADSSTVPACLLGGPGRINLPTSMVVILCHEGFQLSDSIQFGA